MTSEERLRELEEKYEDYKVYDNRGEKIGKVDDLFVDESDNEEYIGVKLGLFGMKSTLIPMDIVRVNEAEKSIEVSESKDHVKDAPTFGDDDEVTAEYEERIRSHFGLEPLGASSSRGTYGVSSGAVGARDDQDYPSQSDRTDDDSSDADTEYRERTDSSTATSTERDEAYDERSESSSGTSASSTGSSTGSFGDGESTDDRETSGTPTSRRTEETETFQEGGRTKVRRRIIREEIVEEDPGS